MASPLPANVNLIQLLAANPATALVGTEPFETVQNGTSVACTGNQLATLAQTNFTTTPTFTKVTAGSFNATNTTIGYAIAGVETLSRLPPYTILTDPAGNIGLQLGDSNNPSLVINEDTYYFNTRAGARRGVFDLSNGTTATLSVGQAGTAIGVLNLAGNTSGVVTITPQATAGTWNFNLPMAAGTTGWMLTSGGGGTSAMTWLQNINLATTGPGGVTGNLSLANITALTGLSVLGVTGTATGTMAAITGTADQALVINHAATGLVFGPLNLATSAAVTGVLPTVNGGIGTSSLGQIPGTTTNDNASAGNDGELIEVDVPAVSISSLTTTTGKTIASALFSAGDWDVTGILYFAGNATTAITVIGGEISTINNQVAGVEGKSHNIYGGGSTLFNNGFGFVSCPLPTVRFSLASSTTIFASGYCQFGTSTAGAYGTLRGRRVR